MPDSALTEAVSQVLPSSLFGYILGGIVGVLAWIFTTHKKDVEKRIDRIEEYQKEYAQSLAAHRENSSEKYATKVELREISQEVIRVVSKLEVTINDMHKDFNHRLDTVNKTVGSRG